MRQHCAQREPGTLSPRSVTEQALLNLMKAKVRKFSKQLIQASVSRGSVCVQETVVQRLQLTAVEWHAYRRCHKDTAEHAQQLLPEGVLKAVAESGAVAEEHDRELTHREADALFPRLIRLRQVRSRLDAASTGASVAAA